MVSYHTPNSNTLGGEMTEYRFRAPSLFDAAATATGSNTVYHDAPVAGEQLARFKPCAQWLADQMAARGVRIIGPDPDEGGWMISVPAKSGFALIILDIGTKEDQPFEVLVSKIGSAEHEVAQAEAALKAILESPPIVSDLTIKD
jgi:hypothetical protein